MLLLTKFFICKVSVKGRKSHLSQSGLPPNHGNQGNLVYFIFNLGKKIFCKIRESQGSFKFSIIFSEQ